MRTIASALTTAQALPSNRYTAAVEIEGVDQSTYLTAYTYREAAMLAKTSQVWLDNTSGIFTTSPPLRGDTVDLERGCFVRNVAYRAELPRLWVEKVTFEPGSVILTCIDFWGRLARYRSTWDIANWVNTHITAVIDWLFVVTYLTRDGDTDDTYIDYKLPRGQSGDVMLKNVCAKVSQYPYAGLDRKVQFKALDSAEASVYTFGWNASHPVISANHSTAAPIYNKVTVYGALQTDDTRYSGSDTNTTESALVGTREKFIIDPSLASDAACAARAEAELTYYSALSTTASIVIRPCFGLELFDVVTLTNAPWGAVTLTARISSYTEHFHPDAIRQELAVNSASTAALAPATARMVSAGLPANPALAALAPLSTAYGSPGADPGAGDVSEAWLQAANLPTAVIADASAGIISPGSLSGLHTVGAVVYDTSADTHITTAPEAHTAFYASTGRTPEVGDVLVDYDETDSTYRFYVKVAGNTWAYFDTATTLT